MENYVCMILHTHVHVHVYIMELIHTLLSPHPSLSSLLSPHPSLSSLLSRFRSLEVVSHEVTRLVHSDPVSFSTIPDAAQLLAGAGQGAGPGAPELYHLLYWRNVSPASTLIFFYRPFSHHPITAQFASKAMQSFKPVSECVYLCFTSS